MSHKYDIYSDSLKCNFCTQWFKCSIHYANIQRYSLKACNQCLTHFHYTLLHPQTYRIYNVFLFDTGIQIGQGEKWRGKGVPEGIARAVEEAEQEVRDGVCRYFQDKIKEALEEMQKAKKRVEESMNQLKKQVLEIDWQGKVETVKIKKDLMQKINDHKSKPLEQWINPKSKIVKTASTHTLSHRKKSQSHILDKENLSVNQGWGKSIKYKVGMRNKEGKNSMKSSVCLDSKPNQPLREQSPSLTNSIHSKSVKRLDISLSTCTLYQQRDLAQVIKLLESGQNHVSYLPYETHHPQNSLLIKNESKRTQADAIIDIRSRMAKGGQLLQLIGTDISRINFNGLLRSLGQQSGVKTMRVIKAGLGDHQFDCLLRFLSKHPSIQTLIVTNNKLTQLSLYALLKFRSTHPITNLSYIYMGSNRIGRQHASAAVSELQSVGLHLLL